MKCSNCNDRDSVCKGRCKRCYNWFIKHGSEHPLTFPKPNRNCTNPHCDNAGKLVKGLCNACRHHMKRHGELRIPKKKLSKCSNCDSTKLYAMTRCNRCYWYWRKYGKERDPNVIVKPKRTVKPCCNPNCNKLAKRGIRCDACFNHLKKYGVERSKEQCEKIYYRRTFLNKQGCKICGDKNVRGYMRCNVCLSYYNKYGKDRARHLWDKDATCLTCGIPLKALPSKEKRKGWCRRCYTHLLRYGVERPREKWDIGLYGWCDCGIRADHQIQGKGVCGRCKDKQIVDKRRKA